MTIKVTTKIILNPSGGVNKVHKELNMLKSPSLHGQRNAVPKDLLLK